MGLFSKKSNVAEYFNPKLLQSKFELHNMAKVDDIERWLENKSLKISYFYEEIKGFDTLPAFSFILNDSEEGKEKLKLLQEYGLDLNKTTNSGKNAAMSFIESIKPAFWLKQEKEKAIPEEQFHDTEYLKKQLLYYKKLGLDFYKEDQLTCTALFYAFKNVVCEDISEYPDLFFVCNTIRDVLSIYPKLFDFLVALATNDFNVNTCVSLLKQFYKREDIEYINKHLEAMKQGNVLNEEKYNSIKECILKAKGN